LLVLQLVHLLKACRKFRSSELCMYMAMVAADRHNGDQPVTGDDPTTTTPIAGSDELPEQQPRKKRALTSTEEIDHAIRIPASVRINVKGACIVESRSTSPSKAALESGRRSPPYETSDIRLPHHNGVVSHIAVDVCAVFPSAKSLEACSITDPVSADWRNLGQACLLLLRTSLNWPRRKT
jgi:hypothetical protein